MSRPFTCLCLIMAASSGLYLYNSKHDAQVLDQEITRLTQAAAKSRANIDRLRSEYDHLSDPERLKTLAGQWLTLQPTDPKQFAALADLDKRLPAIGAFASPQNEQLAIAEPAAAVSVVQPSVAAEKPPAAPMQVAVAARPTPPPAPAARPATSLLPLIAQSQAESIAPAVQSAAAAPVAQAVRPLPPRPVVEPKQPTQLAALPPTPRAAVLPRAQPAALPPPTPPGLRTTPAVAAAGYNANEMVTRVAQKINPYNPQPPMVGSSLGMARVTAQQPIQARP